MARHDSTLHVHHGQIIPGLRLSFCKISSLFYSVQCSCYPTAQVSERYQAAQIHVKRYVIQTLVQLEVFIEHIPRAERLQDTVQLQYRRDISTVLSRILCRVWPYSHIQSVGVTLTVYNIVKLKRWGQMLRIIGNSWKKQPKQ